MGLKKDVLAVGVRKLREAGHDLIYHAGTDKLRLAATAAARVTLRAFDGQARAQYHLMVVVQVTRDHDFIVKMAGLDEVREGMYGNWIPLLDIPGDQDTEPFRPSPSPDDSVAD